MTKASNRSDFLTAVSDTFGNIDTISRSQILEICSARNIVYPQWLTADPESRVGRGLYKLPSVQTSGTQEPSMTEVSMAIAAPSIVKSLPTAVSYIPDRANGYVPFGCYNDVRSIIKSSKFYPVFITGLSGNGKTMIVEQACANEQRECIRVNITIETDEDDLIGGFRLVDGKTVWHDGPVIQAMQRGAILLLDEVDLGSNKLMCLQPVLEGKPIFLKKTNRIVAPVGGFNVIATANTKGKGSDDGRFIGTNILNEAFLERFSVTMEQEYPSSKIEEKILNNVLKASNMDNSQDFVKLLVSWAEVIRKSFADGAVSEIISTRRLVHICEAYAIFRHRDKSIELCLNRFDADTKKSFIDLFKKMDPQNMPMPPDIVSVQETQ